MYWINLKNGKEERINTLDENGSKTTQSALNKKQ